MAYKETFVEVMTLGELGRDTAPAENNQPRTPVGCHWFRDCEECRWEDCVAGNHVTGYDSDKGRRLRGMAFAMMLRAGLPLPWLAEFFDTDEERALEEARLHSEEQTMSRGEQSDDREALKTEAIKRRMTGEPETLVAINLGVSPRQVRRWCHGALGLGHNHGASNRHRSAPLPIRQNFAVGVIERRCAVVRQQFE